jgi:phenylacetate-CoA ligase
MTRDSWSSSCSRRASPVVWRGDSFGSTSARPAVNSTLARAKDFYQGLPPTLRHAAASAYGWYLRWWRYGSDTDGLVAQARLREAWTEDQWRRHHDEVLRRLLHHAATAVPYYRNQWLSRRAAGDDSPWELLENWPVLSKEEVRKNPTAFLADSARPSRMFRLSTSGTSGSPVTTWRSRRMMHECYALFEARTRGWYGVDRYMRWAILGGQIVTPAAQTTPPFWSWNGGLRQLYFSTLHLSSANVGAYIGAMRRYRVRYLFGYASSMYWLAKMAREQALDAPRLIVAVSNAEPLHPHQREMIGGVFGCPVRDTYGMVEIVTAATECEHGVLHIWPEAGVVEVLDDASDAVLGPGQAGRLVGTGLLNENMPLIRYDIGDRGALGPSGDRPCACGRLLPRFERIEGRSSDNLITTDGRRVFWINPIFYELPVQEAQVVQESLGRLRVRLVPSTGYEESIERSIRHRLTQRLGNVEVEFEYVSSIPRGANGKFRPVVNLVEATS